MKLLFCTTSFLLIAMMWTSRLTGQTLEDSKSEATPTVEDFSTYPVYKGNDLGLTYSAKKSTFTIWSPPANAARVLFYDAGEGGEPFLTKEMKKGKDGEWSLRLKRRLEGKFYTFQVRIDTTWFMETPDPYAVAAGVNGRRAMVVDLTKTNPPGWEQDQRPPLKSYNDIVLYELHVRDASIHPSSGIKNKGKYLGLTETGTKSFGGESTGLDHIRELGVTHVHLLPVFEFRSVDESNQDSPNYNWGYDPQNYNTPEGSYSTNPYDGSVRIREFKQMVKAFHDNGLRVVMDVVYNHTGSTEESVFNQLVPGYYYRQNPGGGFSNASACGNETASERAMMRKFMVESMVFWAKEYHIDGFRVDLMGIHDIETMNMVAAELRKVDPAIFIYGEGWTAGGSPLDEKLRAVKSNTNKLDGIAAFSDEFRDGVKGHVFTPHAKGFATGEDGLMESVKFGIVGAVKHPQVNNDKVNYSKAPWAKETAQCINYVSCHDNHSLYDRIANSCPGISERDIVSVIKFMQTIVLTSQGIPFLHAGEEITRTKFGVENSYESPDAINQIVWANKEIHRDLFNYHRDLIKMRKNHPAFRMGSAEAIAKHLEFLDFPIENILGYVIKDNANGDSWKRILLIFNGNNVGKQVNIPEGNWKIIAREGFINEAGLGNYNTGKANLAPRSALILAEE